MAFADKVRAKESGGDDTAQAKTSSASGRYQFTKDTFVNLYKQVYKDGLPADRIWEKRFDGDTQDALMRQADKLYTGTLRRSGLPATDENKYMLHFLGPKGAKVLNANPDEPVSKYVSKSEINANRSLLSGKTVGEVINWTRRQMGSVSDRVAANRNRAMASREVKMTEQDGGFDVNKVYSAYQLAGKPGGMSPKEAREIEVAANSGSLVLPSWFKLRTKPSVIAITPKMAQAYNTLSDMPDSVRDQIDTALANNEIALPKGLTLKRPAPRTAGESLGMGVRGVLEGAGGLVDIAAAPVNAIVNTVAGTNLSTTPFQDAASAASNAMGLPAPATSGEKLTNALIGGGTQGLLTAGAGLAAAGAKGATGVVGRALASNPVLDTVSGATSGLSGESARQEGAGGVGQFAASVIGGLTPVGVASVGRRIAGRVANAVEVTPKAVVIDETGNLTPDGQEFATRYKMTPEEVKQAYEAPRTPAQAAPEMVDTLPQAEPPPISRTLPSGAPETPIAPEARTAAERVQEAASEGIRMSRGQATRNFDIQDAENRLKNMNGEDAAKAREFFAGQIEDVKAASERFKSAFGDTAASAEERGTAIRAAVEDLRDAGAEGVKQLYKQARELGAPVELNTAPIEQAFNRVMVEADVPDAVKAVIKQEAARYGLIGEVAPIKETGAQTSEAGITKVKLDDGSIVQFYGEPKKLGLDNAEDFRKVVSSQYMADGGQKLSQILKGAIDDAVENTVASLPASEGNVSEALKSARTAFIEQKKTFGAKDIIQDMIDWKRGAENTTYRVKPEDLLAKAIGKESDLKRLKAVLLAKPTPKSIAAWRTIQAHGLAEIFNKATTKTTNVGGDITDALSGAKLRTAISNFTPSKLKVLLDPAEYNQLMKLQRIIADVTVPISGTTNPSGSGLLIMRLLSTAENKATAALTAAGAAVGGPFGAAIGGVAGQAISPVVKGISEAKAAAKTAQDVVGYTADAAMREAVSPPKGKVTDAMDKAKENFAGFYRDFIDTFSSPRAIAPLIVGSQTE